MPRFFDRSKFPHPDDAMLAYHGNVNDPDCVFVGQFDGQDIPLYKDSSSESTPPWHLVVILPIVLYCVYNHGILYYFTPESIFCCFLCFLCMCFL
jgi:hypothetical protein